VKRATAWSLGTGSYVFGSMTTAAVAALSTIEPHGDGNGWHHLLEPITLLSILGTGAVTFAARIWPGGKEPPLNGDTLEKKLPPPIPPEELPRW
jgi:hypothetical protein